jgi:hypothetical protein
VLAGSLHYLCADCLFDCVTTNGAFVGHFHLIPPRVLHGRKRRQIIGIAIIVCATQETSRKNLKGKHAQ